METSLGLRIWPMTPSEEHSSSLQRYLVRQVSAITAWCDSIFGRTGLLGVDSVYFDNMRLALELLETTLQLIQVYRMTFLLPRVGLIRTYVVLLIATCWSLPMVHRYYHDRFVERRIMSLLCDAVLDMVSSIGVSFLIFATSDLWFPAYQVVDDVWFTNMQQEQNVMVVSWADLASRLVFALGLLQCMDAIKDILTPTQTPRQYAEKSVVPNPGQSAVITPITTTERNQGLKPKQVPMNSHQSRLIRICLDKVGPAFFLVLGLWFWLLISSQKHVIYLLTCPVSLCFVHGLSRNQLALLLNSSHQLGGISGSQESMATAWNTFEFSATARILIRHCPRLEMPSTLQKFHQMTTFKLYNCSISAWSIKAAVTVTTHENLRALVFVRVDFPNGRLPEGLVTPAFPPKLLNFVTSTTNLTHFSSIFMSIGHRG